MQAEIEALKKMLKQKDELLMRENERRSARSKAHIDILAELAAKENELKSSQARCASLEIQCATLEADYRSIELLLTKMDERRVHSQQTDSVAEETLTSELPQTKEESRADEELPQKEEESSREVELPQREEESSREVEQNQNQNSFICQVCLHIQEIALVSLVHYLCT